MDSQLLSLPFRFLSDYILSPFSVIKLSPFLFDYLPSAYLFSAQLWNISEIILFPLVVTLVSRSNSLWSPSLSYDIVSLCHDMKVARHPGHWKTLELVSRNYWWPQMSRYIGQYVSTYDLCLRTKPIRQAPVGKLHPLRILDLWWNMLSVDFIVELPLSSRCNAVMTVVDLISKRAHFIPMHTTVTAEKATRLFLYQVWKLHSLPKCVVSDCRP